MQFYQKRDFGALVSDTFSFFKIFGKNYFKNYISLNGILLILLVVLYVVGYRNIFAQMISGNTSGQSYYFEQYFQENMVIMVVFGLLFLLVGLTFVFLIYTLPVLYLKRLVEFGEKDITVNQLLSDFKKNFWKFVKFILGAFFIILPITMLLMVASFFLMFIIIGFFLLLLLFPFLSNVINFTLYDYFNTDRGFFGSLSYALRSQFSYSNGRIKSPFWKYWASSTVMYIIVQILSGLILMVPMIIMGLSALTVPQGSGSDGFADFFSSGLGIIFFILYAISILFTFILMNANYINAGLMYYYSRLDLHRQEDFNEIESIGSHEI